MEITLVSCSAQPFQTTSSPQTEICTGGNWNFLVSTLETLPDVPLSTLTAKWVDKIEYELSRHGRRDGKRQKLSMEHDNLKVCISYGINHWQNYSLCKINEVDKTGGLLKRLAKLCGGYQNIKANLSMEFDNVKLDLKDLCMERSHDGTLTFETNFDMPENLAAIWDTLAFVEVKVCLLLKLNNKAVSRLHLATCTVADVALVFRQELCEANISGDTVIVGENKVEVHCHQFLLRTCSKMFKTMLDNGERKGNRVYLEMSDISEKCLMAMLAYLYCFDLEEILISSWIAVELLRVSKKYGFTKLFEVIKQLLLSKENEWFCVFSTVQLVALVWHSEHSNDFEELTDKANNLLESKSGAEVWKRYPNTEELDILKKLEENLGTLNNICEWINLLQVADKNECPWLGDKLKPMIIRQQMCTLDDAVSILMLTKGKKGTYKGLKSLKDKAMGVLKLKSPKELKQCSKFRKACGNPDDAIEMCMHLMQDP